MQSGPLRTSATQQFLMKLRTILLLPLRLGRLRKSSRRRYIVPLGDAPPQSNVAPLTSAQAAAHAEAEHISRLAIGIAATRAKRLAMSADAAEPCRYTDEDAFFDELDRDQRLRVVGRHLDHVSKPLLLLRATWLKGHHTDRQFRLPATREELPAEATITVDELRQIHRESSAKVALPVIVLSHFRRTAEDSADPHGITARLLVDALVKRWHGFTRRGVQELGVLIAWCGWEEGMDAGMEASPSADASLMRQGLWFAHAGTTVWMATTKGVSAEPAAGLSTPSTEGHSYWALGHCVAEFALANLLKPANNSSAADWPQLVDLGKEDGPDVAFDRPAPLTPLAFHSGQLHGEDLVYTARAPRDSFVAPLFERTCVELLSTVEELDFSGARWGDKEAVQLAHVLPLCVRLRVLRLENNDLGDVGVSALAVAMAYLPAFETLKLLGNPRISQRGMAALARAGGSKPPEPPPDRRPTFARMAAKHANLPMLSAVRAGRSP